MTLSDFLKLTPQQKQNGVFIQGDENNGVFVSYFPNGELEYRYSYKDGKLHGEFISNWEDGSPFFKGMYENGEKEGEWIKSSRNGKHTARIIYHKGALIDGGDII